MATPNVPFGPSSSHQQIPPAVNFHLWKPCNLNCRFCFAIFNDDPELRAIRGGISEADAQRILALLRPKGVNKINFAGGEPTLCPHLAPLLCYSRELGFVNSIVTNGARLRQVLDDAPGCVDWVGLSVDSAIEKIQAEIERGDGDHVRRSIENFQLLHRLGIHPKLNTVVTSLNWQEDMTEFVLKVKPERWKIFQALPVEGQNDGRIESLLITAEQFASFVNRHQKLAASGILMAPEHNDHMTGSYAMIDPLGRFFSNATGRHIYSHRILDVGVDVAFNEIPFFQDRFEGRGGLYEW